MPQETVQDNVFSTTPPQTVNVGAGGDSYIKAKLPEFISIMTKGDDAGRMDRAFAGVCEKSQGAFSDLYNAACYELAHRAGFFSKDNGAHVPISKMTVGGGISGFGEAVNLAKGFNATTAPGLYLHRLIALMLPVLNPWRQRVNTQMPTVGGQYAQWRTQMGFASTVLAMIMRTPEADSSLPGTTGGNGVPISETPTLFQAPFADLSTNGIVTYKAIAAMRGYDDPVTVELLENLTALLRGEEMMNVIGNYAGLTYTDMGTVDTTPTGTGLATGGALPTGTYTVKITALTGLGYRLTQEIPSYIGAGTYTINGASTATRGETQCITSPSISLTSGGSVGSIVVTWTPIPNALAYNVYLVDHSSNNRWNQVVTIPKATITTEAGSGNAAPTGDTSPNTYGFEGVSQWAGLATVYSQTIPSKSSVLVNGAGAALTLTGPNSISQFDTILEALFRIWNITPSLILCSPKSAKHLTKIIGSSTNPGMTVFIQSGAGQGQLVGGTYATQYINSFGQYLQNAPATIPVLAHPYYTDGRYEFICENIPYPNARQARAWQLETLLPYTYIPLGALTANMPFMLTCSEVLECVHPSAQGSVYAVDVA